MRLVWDTSSLNLSLALFRESELIYSQDETREKHQQSKLLFQVLKECLEFQCLSPGDITQLAVGIGPGSYTGLRVGLTVAKTWSFARNIPCFYFRSDLALKRTKEQDAALEFPQVKFLQWPEDFSLVQDLNELKPLYHNDHFA